MPILISIWIKEIVSTQKDSFGPKPTLSKGLPGEKQTAPVLPGLFLYS
jgi:hypothetical protein